MYDEWHWFLIDINPEPWAIGPVSVGKTKGGKMYANVGRNQQLWHFQQAVKEAMGTQEMIVGREVQLELYFWRDRAAYQTHQARSHRKHEADVTNMQKATEDALQGVLYDNDKNVKDIHSVEVEQGEGIEGKIGIGIKYFSRSEQKLPKSLQELLQYHEQEKPEQDDTGWLDNLDKEIF